VHILIKQLWTASHGCPSSLEVWHRYNNPVMRNVVFYETFTHTWNDHGNIGHDSMFNITSLFGTGPIGSLVTVAQYVYDTGGCLM
jgi:hypothetical protein